MPGIDPIAEFREAMDAYRQCRSKFLEVDRQFAGHGSGRAEQPFWFAAKSSLSIATEGLWTAGMASMFNLLDTNYRAQERLVEEQLKLAKQSAASAESLADKQLLLAKRNTDSAEKVATWTMGLVIVTGFLILATVLPPFIGWLSAR